ncbi:YqaJ viral recombinase family protein [Microbacterium sp. NPDC091662]|uniref:YqaJ viral recombinase family protein n=1 Tax=Microbacterium sp. NPDC091662 TaxID=3364211 RepID=UPI00381C94B4
MTFTLVHDGKDRASWLAARSATLDSVSATDAARIMTGSAQGWASLRKEKASNKSWRGNAATQHGRDREPVIAAFGLERFGLQPSTALLGRWGHERDMATPDALSQPVVADLGIDEVDGLMRGVKYRVAEFGEYKTTVKDWPTWADVPKRYYWQVVWQFLVTGADRCRFIFEAHENGVPLHMEPRVFTIERADVLEDIERALERVAEWRAGGDDADEVPEALLPLDGLLTAHEVAKEAADAAAERLAAIADEIRLVVTAHQAVTGETVRFEGSDGNVNLSTAGTRTGFDAKAFKARYPAAARRFTTTTPTQPRLTITGRN